MGLIPDFVSGDGWIDVVVNDISLLPGTYDVHTIVHDFNRQHEYDHLTPRQSIRCHHGQAARIVRPGDAAAGVAVQRRATRLLTAVATRRTKPWFGGGAAGGGWR